MHSSTIGHTNIIFHDFPQKSIVIKYHETQFKMKGFDTLSQNMSNFYLIFLFFFSD